MIVILLISLKRESGGGGFFSSFKRQSGWGGVFSFQKDNSNQPTRFGRRRRPNRVLVALRLGSVFYSILFCSSMKDKILTVIWTSGKNTEPNLLKEAFYSTNKK